MRDNPLLVPYIGDRCPQCGEEYKNADDLRHTKFGANARPVHTTCWDAYTGEIVQTFRELAESIWMKKKGRHVILTDGDLALIQRGVRPTCG